MRTPRVTARVVVGVLSLADGLHLVVRFPGFVGCRLAQPPSSGEGYLHWLVTLGEPWRLWLGISIIVGAGWAVGVCLAGLGLVLGRGRVVVAGLVAVAPSLVLRALLAPRDIARLAGRAGWGVAPSGVSPELAREGLALQGAAAICATMLCTLYVLWVWRELRRMPAQG